MRLAGQRGDASPLESKGFKYWIVLFTQVSLKGHIDLGVLEEVRNMLCCILYCYIYESGCFLKAVTFEYCSILSASRSIVVP